MAVHPLFFANQDELYYGNIVWHIDEKNFAKNGYWMLQLEEGRWGHLIKPSQNTNHLARERKLLQMHYGFLIAIQASLTAQKKNLRKFSNMKAALRRVGMFMNTLHIYLRFRRVFGEN